MDEFKQRNFLQANPGEQRIGIEPLPARIAWQLRAEIASRLKVSPEDNGLAIVAAIRDRGVRVAGYNAESDAFDLYATITSLDLRCSVILFVNWYRFDALDVVAASELSRRFSDIWYPSADDIEVFDSSCDWLLSIIHTGDVLLTRTPLTPV